MKFEYAISILEAQLRWDKGWGKAISRPDSTELEKAIQVLRENEMSNKCLEDFYKFIGNFYGKSGSEFLADLYKNLNEDKSRQINNRRKQDEMPKR